MKAVFFDIDGTLWGSDMKIPDSTKEALRRLKENGVYIFICSGRTKVFIKDPALLALGFDGMVSGCGTCVEFQEQEILYKSIPCDVLEHTVSVLKRYHMPVILEGRSCEYMDEADFMGDPFLDIIKRDVGENMKSISGSSMEWEASKFSAAIKNDNYREALTELNPWYDFLVHGTKVVEGVPKGFSKATGMQAMCRALNISHEDTYAFGDSVNDLEMLKFAAWGIAMGNGTPEAKAAADYVTDSVNENGIYNACRHFSLI
mgnify:CR=1 FL=1